MSDLTRKEKSKIICNHLNKRIFGFKDNEDVYIACIMDALKEIEKTENNNKQ